ncbi:MAG: hypothetical protein JO228_10285 [Xanthobacteraceae bacterium]|nr:hypothetical protein [Xanthobacteraceae bacterium]
MLRTRHLITASLAGTAAVMLASCSSTNSTFSSLNPLGSATPKAPPATPLPPPSLHADEITGRWGLASYHRDADRARTEAAARGQCNQPYVIERSASGGVLMLGHDNPAMVDMTIKASYENKTYIGPGPTPKSNDDREVVSFDGKTLVLKWVDPEIAGRYGIMVLVRCGAEGTPPARTARARRPGAAPAADPPPQPQ